MTFVTFIMSNYLKVLQLAEKPNRDMDILPTVREQAAHLSMCPASLKAH